MTINSCTAALSVAAFLLFSVADGNAQTAGGTLEKIASSGEFVVGYRADSSPLSYQDADGRPSGYAVDICRRVGASINAFFPDKNIETRFVRINADERISAVVDGKIDIECGSTTITLSRQEDVDFSLPTFVTGGSVLTLAAARLPNLSDLAGKKIGVAKGTTTLGKLRSYLDDHQIDADVVVLENRDEGMRRLDRGEIHALASDQIVLIGQIMEATDPKRYSLAGEIFSFEPYGLVLRRNDAAFRLVVNRSIARLYRSGDHADLYYKWIGRIGIDVPPVLAAMYQLNALPE